MVDYKSGGVFSFGAYLFQESDNVKKEENIKKMKEKQTEQSMLVIQNIIKGIMPYGFKKN